MHITMHHVHPCCAYPYHPHPTCPHPYTPTTPYTDMVVRYAICIVVRILPHALCARHYPNDA